MVDVNNVLGLIRYDKQFRKGFMAKAKEIYADIISFVSNPNCTCRKRISKYIIDNKGPVDKYYQDWIESTPKDVSEKLLEQIAEEAKQIQERSIKPPQPEQDLLPESVPTKVEDNTQPRYNNQHIPRRVLKDVSGDVLEIEPDPMAYKEAILTGRKEGWRYRGLTVLETFKEVDGKEKAVWLIMFY